MKEENNQIVFTGALSLDDAHKSTRYQLIVKRKYPITYLVVTMSALSFLLYYAFKDESTSQQTAIILTMGTMAVGLICLAIAAYYIYKKRSKDLYTMDPIISKEAKYTANDDGLKIEMMNEVVRYHKWEDLLESYEFSDMFLIYVNSISIIYIPKSFFETQEDTKNFGTLLSQKTKFKVR